MLLHVRRVPKFSERNLDLIGRLGGILFEGRIVGCAPKSHNVPHRLRMERLMSIYKHG